MSKAANKATAKSLKDRHGYREGDDDGLGRELGKLAKRYGLLGCVLVSFKGDRLNSNFSGANDMMYRAMDELATKLLIAINDDPNFAPTCHLN